MSEARENEKGNRGRDGKVEVDNMMNILDRGVGRSRKLIININENHINNFLNQ